ncbi:hypothetical protein C7293_29100 [filamentous cyanobacterium CCT1]|nr:hypothetical protein C7293_29100 [filamentous cyanobacterium CCT1]PSN77322.1 hypothetical protein C8B47_22680 [filamentous cyanobacterium CCP4]
MHRHLGALALTSLSLVALTLPAIARPEIASGDQLLETDVEGCLTRADRLIETLGVESDQGSIDRTGYFEDGSFRVLCYGAGEANSLAIVFATHDQSAEIASNFIQMMLSELSQNEAVSQQ